MHRNVTKETKEYNRSGIGRDRLLRILKMANEVDDCIKRLMSHKGVTGVVVVNIDGVPIKSTLENALSIQYTAQILQMVDKARNWVKEIDGSNDLTFLRLRTTKHEVVICPEGDYTIFVIQEPFTYQYL